MKGTLPAPAVGAIIAIVVLALIGLGYFFLNRGTDYKAGDIGGGKVGTMKAKGGGGGTAPAPSSE